MDPNPRPLLRDDAADALRGIAHTQQRSATAFGYAAAAPHLFLWGPIWMLGYTANWFWPQAWWVWPVLASFGLVCDWRLGRAYAPSAAGWRYGASVGALLAFVAALFAILPPHSDSQINAVFAMLVAIAYLLLGIWKSAPRLALLGLAVGALNLAGYFWLPQWFLLWMAALGGGALILGGVWLRRI